MAKTTRARSLQLQPEADARLAAIAAEFGLTVHEVANRLILNAPRAALTAHPSVRGSRTDEVSPRFKAKHLK